MDGTVTYTRDQAVAQAQTFDTIAANRYVYRNFVADMKAVNPDLVLLTYLNGTFAQKDQATMYPEGWYARDAKGNKVRSNGFGNYLMNPTEPGWVADVIERCRTYLATSGYDGCFLDTMGVAPTLAGYVNPGQPIDPSTGQPWRQGDWLAATTAIAEQVRSSVGVPVFVNGIANGSKYFATDASTSALVPASDGTMVELFVRPPYAPVGQFRSETLWKRDVDMLVDAAASGRKMVVVTKVWSSATAEQKDALHRYALATFLLGFTPGLHEFTFRYSKGPVYEHPYWATRIGEPIGGYVKLDGAYQRRFTNGSVVVNPTASALEIPIDGSFTTLGGGTVEGTLHLAAHSADVLTPAGGSAP